jgi:hypothetical protein
MEQGDVEAAIQTASAIGDDATAPVGLSSSGRLFSVLRLF